MQVAVSANSIELPLGQSRRGGRGMLDGSDLGTSRVPGEGCDGGSSGGGLLGGDGGVGGVGERAIATVPSN